MSGADIGVSCQMYRLHANKTHVFVYRLIEHESEKTHRPCTEILFDEWGTSGRVRPALGHLLYLLTKAELFRAADYVAVNLLHQNPPERPKDGPAALVTIDLLVNALTFNRNKSFTIYYFRN